MPLPTEPQGVRPSFLDLLGWVLARPGQAMRFATREAPLGWALGVLLGVALLGALASALQLALEGPSEGAGQLFLPETPALEGSVLQTLQWFLTLASPLFALVGAVLWTATLHWVASLLGKKEGRYGGLLRGVGFAALPGVFGVPLILLKVAVPAVGGPLSALGGLALAIWGIALQVIAIRENYRFTTARAWATLLIPIGVAFALVLLLVILVVVVVLALVLR